jgi:hypothetical protein
MCVLYLYYEILFEAYDIGKLRIRKYILVQKDPERIKFMI